MKKIKAYFADFDASVLTTRRAVFFEILAALLGGIILGILIAPPKKVKVGCNNGNTVVKDDKKKKKDQDQDGCECCCECDCDSKKEEEK
ncbi:MAG: hypothetical protein IKO11_09615 [Lachnospiraceae bacterium]|nr:hypothetical protein [Lachnospiraceae bacterium]